MTAERLTLTVLLGQEKVRQRLRRPFLHTFRNHFHICYSYFRQDVDKSPPIAAIRDGGIAVETNSYIVIL